MQKDQLDIEIALAGVDLTGEYCIRNGNVVPYAIHTLAVNVNVIQHFGLSLVKALQDVSLGNGS
jgi:hypothetical protein